MNLFVNEKPWFHDHVSVTFHQLYVQDANYIWSLMKQYEAKKINMTHDGYLKLYQLSKPKLNAYDCILIDEAQDLTPGNTSKTYTKIQLYWDS